MASENEKVKNKTARLYEQCLSAYERYRQGSQIIRGGVSAPDPFDDRYAVPAELLFIELCKMNKKWQDDRAGFDEQLLTWLFQSKEFNLDIFNKTKANHGRRAESQYEVYFEVILRNGQKKMPPFRGVLEMKKTTFQWCQLQEMIKVDEAYIASEIKRRQASQARLLSDKIDVYRHFRKYPDLRNKEHRDIHRIKATLRAESDFQAATIALKEFGIVSDCFNAAYGIGRYSITLTPGQDDKAPEERIVLCDTGVCLVKNQASTTVRYPLKCVNTIMPASYSPTQRKNKLFQTLLQCFKTDSAINSRIKNVVQELVLAFSARDRGLMHLAYWRCLEHATRRADGTFRRESDIVKIFQNYYPQCIHWKQMGRLVEKLRNGYAHNGVVVDNGCSKQYLNWSQKYAECALYILLYLKKHEDYWNTNSKLDKFFDYYVELDESLEVAQVLLKERRRVHKN